MMRNKTTKYYGRASAICLACLLGFGLAAVRAQQTTGAAGGTASGGTGSISYTVGQIDYKTYPGSGGSVAEGVQQPLLDDGELPVTLISFEASFRKNEGVLLIWETVSEFNNDHFTIERSTNGKTFEELTQVKGKGNSERSVKYQFTDFFPHPGSSYYRLKQTDHDGSFSYSRIRSVVITDLPNYLSVYPNPTTDYLNIDAHGMKSENLSFRIVDVSGKLLESQVLTEKKSSIDIRFLQAGMYVIAVFHNNNTVRTFKVIKN
jgi:hypothetical protein